MRWLISLLALCAIAWAFVRSSTQLHEIQLNATQLLYLLSALVLKTGVLFLRAYRYDSVVATTFSTSARGIKRIVVVGYAANALLFLRMGDLLRIVLAARATQLPKAALASTMIVERVADILCLVLFAGFALWQIPLPNWLGDAIFAALVSTFLLLLALVAFGTLGRLDWGILTRRLPPALTEHLRALQRGLAATRNLPLWRKAISITLAIWLLELIATAVLLRGVMSSNSAALQAATVLTPSIALGMAIPGAPAGLGTHQAVYLSILALFGVPAATAIALSLGITLGGLASLAILGWLAAHSLGLTLGSIRAIRQSAERTENSHDDSRT